jgi:hypothetical protein
MRNVPIEERFSQEEQKIPKFRTFDNFNTLTSNVRREMGRLKKGIPGH